CCIAVRGNVHHYFVVRDSDTAGRGVYDALVGLMGNQPCDLVSGKVVLLHDLRADVGHIDHGELEYSRSFLIDVMELCVYGLMRCRHSASAGLHVEKLHACAIAAME